MASEEAPGTSEGERRARGFCLVCTPRARDGAKCASDSQRQMKQLSCNCALRSARRLFCFG
jgi:hypothetical protein